MKIERVFVPDTAAAAAAARAPSMAVERWPVAGTVAILLFAVLIVTYWSTVRDVAATWESNQTYAHGFLILPVTAWLIWQRRDLLAAMQPRPDLRALPVLLVPGMAWVLGDLAGVKAVEQFALVSLLPVVVWAVLGREVIKALAFPLAFLYFAVPFGEFLVPALMQYTADFTVFALRLTGVPVYRDGLFFTVPTGNWSVVEACSGLRYLIACLTGGTLYAYLRYRSPVRRAIFILASGVVPIIANGFRAYLTVMIDYLSGGGIARDVDHLLYGWIFFAFVTIVLFYVGALWREDQAQAPVRHAEGHAVAVGPRPSGREFLLVGAAALLLANLWPPVVAVLDRADADAVMPVLAAPAAAGNWQRAHDRGAFWTPQFQAPKAALEATYADGARRAGVYVAYYADQKRSAELVSSRNLLVAENGPWRIASEGRRSVVLDGEEVSVTESRLQAASGGLRVWWWYRVDGTHTANPYWAKLVQLRAQLLGRGDGGAVVMLFTDEGRGDAAAVDLADFAQAVVPPITRSLVHAR